MPRDPADFPGNPNPPAKAPEPAAKAPAAAAPGTSAGTGTLPPEAQNSQAGVTPLAPASPSYSVSEDGIYAFSDNDAQKVGNVTLSKEDADKVLKASGALYDKERGTYDNVPESVIKTLSSGRPSMLSELKSRYGLGEAELHRSSLYEAALNGQMSFAEARDRAQPDLVQAQLAQRPGSAWKGLGDAVGRFIEHPVDEGGELLRQSIQKTAEALPSIAEVTKGGLEGAMAGGAAGSLAGPLAPIGVTAGMTFGAAAGTFNSLFHMEAGSMAADLHDRGFQEDTIKKLAPAAAAVKAAMWLYGVDAMTAPFKGVFLKGLAESETAKKLMGSWAAEYAVNAGLKMPVIGAAQSAVADLTNNLAAVAEKRPDLMKTATDFSKNALHAAIDMGQITGVTGLLGAGARITENRGEAKLSAEVDAKLEGVERREPSVNPSPSASRETPSGEKTPVNAAQMTSTSDSSQTPRTPPETTPPPAAEMKRPLSPSITEHPGFVKAVEEGKNDLPPGVEPTDREGVIKAYIQAAQDAHDFNNKAMVSLGKSELGQAPLTPDEQNQIRAQMDEYADKMRNLRELALFARDPEKKAAYEDWKAGGQAGERPELPQDPFNEASRLAAAQGGAEQKLNETLDNKEASTKDLMGALDSALSEGEKKKTPAQTLGEKVQGATVKGRAEAVKSELDALQQRIGEIASTRDRMQRNGMSTRAIDRQVNSLLDRAVSAQKELELIERRGPEELEVSKRAKLQLKPATLQDIVDVGFKEGGKQSQARARELLALAQENDLTAVDVKKLIGNRAIGALGEEAYKNFLEGFDREKLDTKTGGVDIEHTEGFREGMAKLVERKKARAELAAVINEKQIQKEQYVRQLNQMPPFHKMTTEQLRDYADILRGYDKADTALSPKRIAALKGTVLEGIKTEGEARVKAAEITGRPIEDFQSVRVPIQARGIPDPHLRTWYPALRPFVDLAGEMTEKGERLAETVKNRNNDLAAAAIRERRATMGAGSRLADWFAPQQREVMAYLEAKEPADVAAAAANLTPAETKWADFLKSWFGVAEDYLVKKEGLTSRFSGAYAPHVNRGTPEIFRELKEQGILNSLKEFLPKSSQGSGRADFVDANGNVLGFNKFFKQSLFRSGELEPSKNVVSAANRYMDDFYRKAALDQIAPVLDTLASSMKPPETIDPREMQPMTSSIQDFTKAYINNKKGINNSAGAVGELMAPALRLSQTLASIHYIAANYALQAIKGSVAIPVSEFMALGTDLFKAKALKYLPGEMGNQARAILGKYESFTGKSPWQEVGQPGSDAADYARAVTYGGFGLAHKAAMEDILLGSMTKDEFAKGEISDARLNDIRQNAGRWLDLSHSDSVFGSSEVGKTFTQYKKWAIPPVLSIAEDAGALWKAVKSGGKEKLSDQQVHELMRLTAMGAVAATGGSLVSKDMEDDTFTGQSIHYFRRALGSVWHGLDPAFFFSVAGPGYVAKLAQDLHLLATLEEDKDGDSKGVKALKKDLTPRIAKDIEKKFDGSEE